MTETQPSTMTALDIEALREKYRIERDRRLAANSAERCYRDPAQGFDALLNDPYGTAPPRAPCHDEVDVFVVGGGFGGLMTAAQLAK